jgi:hypothetical protein
MLIMHARPARFIRRSSGSRGECQKPPEICDEAFALVARQILPKRTVVALGRMVPTRQVAAVRMMVTLANLSGDLARALLAATPSIERCDDPRGRQSQAVCAGRLAKMERSLVQMQLEAAELRSHYDHDLLYLALASSFVRNWMGNEVVDAWLHSHHPEFYIKLKSLVKAANFAIEPGRPMKLPYSLTASAIESRNSGRRNRPPVEIASVKSSRTIQPG